MMAAEDLDNGEFWLPPKFLSDDDLLMEFGKSKGGSEFSYGFGLSRPNSDLSSPGESVVGSTETESDEDDYLFGLSRKLARSSISDDLWKVETGFGFGFENKKWSANMATSPQSTLCNVNCKQGSSRGSPNCISPPVEKNETAWGLLYAAAGEVAKIRKIEEAMSVGNYSNRAPNFGAPQKQSPFFVPVKNPNNSDLGFGSNQYMSYQQLQVNQFQQLKQQQILKQRQQQQQQQGSLRWAQQQMILQNRARNVANGAPMGSSTSSWPTPQQSLQHQVPQPQQPGSGMRAVFLGNPGAKRGSSGTGVFLPRLAGTATETVKKKGCSTVLLPDRVVQALNLNLKAMESAAPQLLNRSNTNDYDAAMKYRNSVLMAEAQAQQRRNAAMQRQPLPVNNELRLPQEWTY